MKQRRTAISKDVEYDTEECDNCGTEVLIGENQPDNKKHPKGISVVIGGGDNMTVDKTNWSARGRDYRKTRVIAKWFGIGRNEITKTHLCPSCVKGLYDFE